MQRPTAVTVFGILNIVFAALGIFSVMAMLVLFSLVGSDSKNPVVQLIQTSPAYAGWMKISIALGALATGFLLAAGIGLLMLKPWARLLSIIYAIYTMIMIVIGSVVNYFLLVQPLLQQAQQKQGAEAAGAIGGAVGGMFGSCFGLIYPILLLIFMMRANVIAAFRSPPTLVDPVNPV
jgi:hypothetical protein